MRFECIFCDYEFFGVDGMKEHSATCEKHPAVMALAATRAELAEERARLDYIIEQSNAGNGWLDDVVWDSISDAEISDDPLVYMRNHIDAAIMAPQWMPVAEAHEDYGECVFINIHDPGSPVCASTLDLDWAENLEYYEWTHFQPIRLSNEEADKLLAELPAELSEKPCEVCGRLTGGFCTVRLPDVLPERGGEDEI
jgi:hypothetical protein